MDVWLHFDLNAVDQERVREKEREKRDTKKKREKGEYFRPAEDCNTACANISDHCLSFLRSFNQGGKVNTLGWIMDNNLQQSVNTTEHDFLISMGYLIKMKCFPELLTNCLGTR